MHKVQSIFNKIAKQKNSLSKQDKPGN